VLFQLYTRPRISFKIPPTVFYPAPKVTSALVTLDFLQETPGGGPLLGVEPADLKQVLSLSFQQRRKMLRQSLKGLLAQRGLPPLSDEWATRRPEELEPHEFVELTRLLFGPAKGGAAAAGAAGAAGAAAGGGSTRVWRRARHGGYEEDEEEEEEEKE
jgi:16S rRNA (adenine1518-N6/adenine1519-N6)-dimethyltransferase